MRWRFAIARQLGRGDRTLLQLQELHAAVAAGSNDDLVFEQALSLADGLSKSAKDASTWRLLVRVAMASADVVRAARWASAFSASGQASSPEDHRLVGEALLAEQLIHRAAQPLGTRRPGTAMRSVAILAYSLPFETNGYAIRSHGLLGALQDLGWDTRVYTRPGFPADSDARWRDVPLAASSEIDGLVYHRLDRPRRRETGQMEYLAQAVEAYKEVFQHEDPAVVHAASNHMTALPALIAAREMGIAFVYEVRGFWDITRASNDAAFIGSAPQRMIRRLENAVCLAADQLLTLTQAMREELIRRGVNRARIRLAPNGVGPGSIPQRRDSALARHLGLRAGVPVIGYIGSFVEYEGLDDLVRAAARLRESRVDFELLLVGDGLSHARVEALAAELGIGDLLRMPGRVSPSDVPAYYSLIDVCVYPRKPWPVCEMVSPLKPCEAMAQGKAVIASDVVALAEIVSDGRTGLLFRKGDVTSLAACMHTLLVDEALRLRLGKAACEWVRTDRTWLAAARAGHLSLSEAAQDALV